MSTFFTKTYIHQYHPYAHTHTHMNRDVQSVLKYDALRQKNRAFFEAGRCDTIRERCRTLENNKVAKSFDQALMDDYISEARELLDVAELTGVKQLTFFVLGEDRAHVKPLKEYWDARGVFCRIEECHHRCAKHLHSMIQMYPRVPSEHTDTHDNETGF